MGYMGSKSRGYGPPPPGGAFMGGGGGGGNGGTGGGSPPRILPTQVEGPVYSQGGLGPTGGGDPKGWGREDLLPTQVENIPTGGGSPNMQSGAAFSSMLGPPPTQDTPMQTGGGSPANPLAGNAMQQQMANIGGFRAPITSPPNPTQAPQVETGGGSPAEGWHGGVPYRLDDPNAGTGGGSPNAGMMPWGGYAKGDPRNAEILASHANDYQLQGGANGNMYSGGGSPNDLIPPHMLAQALNMSDGPDTGFTPNQGMVNMNRIPAGSAPAAYGGGGTNWQDRPIGPMRQGMGIPQGWTADPNASGNPFWQPILNSRGSWWNERG